VLITGGAGYIGSQTCKALAAAGFTPVTYDNLVNGHRWAVKWGPLVVGDILDRDRLREVFQHYRPAAVMHFAAYAEVEESIEQPLKYYRNNVVGSHTLLEVMNETDVEQLVFSSTCATYGNPKFVPINETHPQEPINPYGASKLMVERMLSDLGATKRVRSISLRYFNAAGADPEGEIGEARDSESHLIPRVLKAASTHSPITVFGDDYETADGTCIRDYIHVADLADAHVLALKALQSGSETACYNLGTGRGSSVREVIEVARSVTGLPIAIMPGARRPGDPSQLVCDASRAKRALGFEPHYDDLYEIVSTTWNWMLKQEGACVRAEAEAEPLLQGSMREPR
jgi:UDP-arabinose 4-epimerase